MSPKEADEAMSGVDNPSFDGEKGSDSSSDDGKKGEYSGPQGTYTGAGMTRPSDMSPKDIRKEKFVILKNILMISIAFMFNFTAYQSMASLQSSINPDAGLGTASLSVLYAALVASCMFVPTWLIQKIKCKWTVSLCMLTYSAYIGAQFYPVYETLIPAAIIVGLGAAPMWSAKCTYLTQVGNRYAELSGEKDSEPTISRFFGVFFMIFQTASIWGNLISSLVLSSDTQAESALNQSMVEDYCGTNFCPYVNLNSIGGEGNSSSPSGIADDKRWLLSGIFLGCSLFGAFLVAIAVDQLTRFGEDSREGSAKGKSGVQLLVATFSHMKNPYQLLIAPLTLWSGFEQAYLGADFTSGFVTCSWGVGNVGYVLICYGACDAICSLLCGSLVKKLGRLPIFTFAAALNLALVIAMFFWVPNRREPAVYFVIAGLWGACDAVWQTQINSFYGYIFRGQEEAAFSNYRLWESFGFIIAYAYQNSICVYAKQWVLIGILVSGMAGYYVIEGMEAKKRKSSKTV